MNNNMKYQILSKKAKWWDSKPHEEIKLTGRVLRAFTPEDFNRRWNMLQMQVTDDFYEQLPTREQVTTERVMDELYYANKANNVVTTTTTVKPMEVPADVNDQWSSISPLDYLENRLNDKAIIDKYLSSLDCNVREETIRNMCTGDSINYLRFLHLDPATMNAKQVIIYNDIIAFYENYYTTESTKISGADKNYINSMKNYEEAFTLRNSQFTSSVEKQFLYSSLVEGPKFDEFINANPVYNDDANQAFDPLNSIGGPLSQITETKILQHDITSADLLQNKVEQQNQSVQKIIKPLEPVKPILQFTPDTKIIQSEKVIAPIRQISAPAKEQFTFKENTVETPVNKVDYRNYNTLSNLQTKNVFNMPECYNITDLIAARKKAEESNNTIIHDIVENQINSNINVVKVNNYAGENTSDSAFSKNS